MALSLDERIAFCRRVEQALMDSLPEGEGFFLIFAPADGEAASYAVSNFQDPADIADLLRCTLEAIDCKGEDCNP